MQSNNVGAARLPRALRDNRAAPPAAPNNAARVPSFAEPYTNPPAEDDTPLADDTLATAMGLLSVQQKLMVEQEIMGKLGVPPEFPQHMNLLLQQLRARLQPIRHKPAFDLAMRQNPTLVNSPQFLRMFLRAERNDVNHAADRLVQHFEAKREIWSDAKLTKRITMDDFTEEEKQFFTKNGSSIQMLPIRDYAGRAVFFSHEEELAESLMDQNPEIHNARFLWYLVMAHLEDDDETQINGIVYVGYGVDSKPKGTKAERDVWWAGCKALNSMPVRLAAFHCCYQGLLMKPLANLMAWGLSPITRCRIQTICGNHAKCVKHLKTFGIPVHVLPLDEESTAPFKQGGQSKKEHLPMRLNRGEFDKFLKRRHLVEGRPMEYAHRIELLRLTDIIVDKEQNYHKRHGNLEFAKLVSERVEEMGAGRSNEETGKIGIMAAIQMIQDGIRFVQQVEKCGIWRLADWKEVKDLVPQLTNRITKANKNKDKVDAVSTSVASKRARSMSPHSGSPLNADNPEIAGMPVANEDEDEGEGEGDEGRVATTSSHQTSAGSDQDAKPAAKRRARPASALATVPAPAVSSPAMQAGAVDDDEVQVVQVTRAPTSMQLTTSAAGAIVPQAQTPTPYGAVSSPNFPQYPAHPRAPTFAAYQQAAIQGRGVQMGQAGMPTGIIPNAAQLPQNLQAQQARPNLQAFGQPQQLLAGPASGIPNFGMPQNVGFRGTGAVPFQTSIAGGNVVGGMTVPTNLYAASAAQPNLAAAVAPNTVMMPTNAGTFPNLMTGVGGATAFNQGTPNMQLPRNLTPNPTQNFTQNMQVPITSAQAQTPTMVAEQMGMRMGRQLALEMAMERGVRLGFNQAMAQGTMPNANMANASTMHTPTMPPQGMMPAPNANTNATPNSQLPKQQPPITGSGGASSDSSTTHALQPASTAPGQSQAPTPAAAAKQPKTAAQTAPDPPAVAPPEDTPEKITERDTDILFGRSRAFHKHSGNIRMHSLVTDRKHLFDAAARTERRQFIADVVDELVAEGRRFLTRRTKDADGTWIWVEVSKERAAEKLGHAFRDRRKKEKGGKAVKAGEEDSQAGASSSGKQISEEAAAAEGLVNLRMK